MAHITVKGRTDVGSPVAVNGELNCQHDNWHVEIDEPIAHPDDPIQGQEVRYAVCDDCDAQGDIYIEHGNAGVEWRYND